MPVPCSTCGHPARLEIDRALASAVPLAAVAEQYDLSTAAVHRHRQSGHLSDVALVEKYGRELQRVEVIQGQAADLFRRVKRLLLEAEEANHHGKVLAATRECLRCLDLLMRLLPPAPVAAQLQDQIVRIDATIYSALCEFFADDREAITKMQNILSVAFEREGV